MHLRIFTTLAIFVIVTITSCQRDCPEITRADLEKILAEIIRLDAEETTINVTDFHPVCLAYSRERERYRYVSVVVEYTCRGSEDCPTISPAVEQIESQCIDGVWNRTAISSAQHTRTVSPAANFLTPTRSNCSFCLSPELITALALTYTADNTTHCVGKLIIYL